MEHTLQVLQTEIARLRAELERQQQALERSRDLLAGALAQAPLVLLLLDMPDLSVRLLNDYGRRYFGMPDEIYRSRLLGASLHSLGRCPLRALDGTPLDWDELPPIRAALAGTLVEAVDLLADHADGSQRVLNCSAAPIRDEAGQMVAAIAMAVDITAQRQVEAQRRALLSRIKDSERLEAVGALSGGIAHEFNNMLATVVGHADLAQMQLDPEHPAQADLQAISASCEHARSLVQGLLNASGGGLALHASLDLVQLLRAEIDAQRPLLAPGILLIVDLPNRPLNVHGDRSALRQLLAALLSHANDTLGERPGEILLATQLRELIAPPTGLLIEGSFTPGHYIELVVADDGPGLDELGVRHAFEALGTQPGQGLGLAAVRGTVRAHRGQLRVRSAPGGGFQAHILFPAIDPL